MVAEAHPDDEMGLDGRMLASVSAVDVVAYLEDRGWEERPGTGGCRRHRISFGDGGWDEVIFPRSAVYPDSTARIREMLDSLSAIYGRSPAEVLSDMMSEGVGDSVEYRIEVRGRPAPIGLDCTVRLMEAHRGMYAAAVREIGGDCAQPVGPFSDGMRSGRVSVDGRTVRITHPSTGAAPRTVPSRLLESAAEIVGCSARSKVPDPELGISCDFVESLLGLRECMASRIEMGLLTWDGRRPVMVEIPSQMFPRMEKVAEMMAPHEDSNPRVYFGRVYSAFNVDETDDVSRFWFEYIDGRRGASKATMLLDGAARRIASDAIKDYGLVSLRGRLVGHGRSREIVEISDFRAIR